MSSTPHKPQSIDLNDVKSVRSTESTIPIATPIKNSYMRNNKATNSINGVATMITATIQYTQAIIQQYTRFIMNYNKCMVSNGLNMYRSHLFVRLSVAFISFWSILWVSVAALFIISLIWPIVLTISTLLLCNYTIYRMNNLNKSSIDNIDINKFIGIYAVQLITFIPLIIFGPLLINIISVVLMYSIITTHQQYVSYLSACLFITCTTPYWALFWYITSIPIYNTLLLIQLLFVCIYLFAYSNTQPIDYIQSWYNSTVVPAVPGMASPYDAVAELHKIDVANNASVKNAHYKILNEHGNA